MSARLGAAAAAAVVAACSGSSHQIDVTTSFVVTDHTGTGMATSPLAPLIGQPIDIDITFDHADSFHDTQVPAGCKAELLSVGVAGRSAVGAVAGTVKREILDKLEGWYVRIILCDTGSPSIELGSAINELNLSFGCSGVPPSAQVRASDGYPELVSVVATTCTATILDVVNNLDIGAHDFTMTIVTGSPRVP